LYELRRERGQEEELNKEIYESQKSEKFQVEFIDSFVADAIFLFSPYGKKLDSAKPLKLEGELPNRYSDTKPYPSDIEWKFITSPTPQKNMEIQWMHATNAKKIAPLIEEAIAGLEATNKQKFPEAMLKKYRRISETTNASFQYDPKSMWMISVKKQWFATGFTEYEKTWEYRLVTP
jgi:hypothetical protein